MTIREMKWSPAEKKIARAAFDKAYRNEMTEIKKKLGKMVSELGDLQEIWSIESYLHLKREEIDEKYDYRYSQLIWVFKKLLNDGYITLKDLEGLSEDKLKLLRSPADKYFSRN